MSSRSILGKSLFLFIVALSAAALILITFLRKEAVREEPVLPVETLIPFQGDLEKIITISGFVESETTVTVLPRIGGTLEDISVEMGDPVEKDQVIAHIDSEPYTLSYNQARAAYLAAESTFKRVSSLYATKSVSQQNYDEAKGNFDALQASYELAELNLSYTNLSSPVKGVVLQKHVSRGSMVAPQVPVVTIGDIENLRVKCGIPEIHYSYFQKQGRSMEVKIRVPAMDNRVYSGTISHIAPYVSSQSRNFSIICGIDDEELTLRPGMFAYVEFVMDKRSGTYYLPYKALSGGGLWYVDEENTARFVPFESQFGNDEFFELPADLADRKYVLKGQYFLEEGKTVRLLGE
ncbi:MAG: efflux RND transporter periplasmic adaptor subunit [Spirochaetales bacterium]|nr:efflux RND transporter periplasmic adaptor subunit [Spirochaetales bacterium]